LIETQVLVCPNGVNYWSKNYTLKKKALLAASDEIRVDGNA